MAILRDAFSIDELMQLILTIAHYNAVVRILATLEIDDEPEYQPDLDAFPLPPMTRQEPASRCD